jgi:hypothetical protein
MFLDLDEARQRAEQCRREAQRAIHTVDVLAWLSLADEWRKLALASDDIDYPMITATPAIQDAAGSFV